MLAWEIEERFDRVVAHKRVERDSVSMKMFKAGDCVAALSFANIRTFYIKDYWNIIWNIGIQAGEEGEAFGAEAFEVGAVWFEGSCKRRGVLDQLAEVALHFCEAILMFFDSRIEPDTEVTRRSGAGLEF